MTPEEAIQQLEFDRDMILFDSLTGEEITPEILKLINKENYLTYIADGIAIEALKEVLQYREIGTVEQVKNQKENLKIAYQIISDYEAIGTVEECRELASIVEKAERNELAKIIDEWLKYSKIGTVEECRKAVEKQKPQNPKDSLKIKPVIDYNGAYVDADTTVYLLCPNCGEMVGIENNCDRFCHECGQAIDNENLEGMEGVTSEM